MTISCPDRTGIVAAISKFLFDRRCNIVESAQFGDRHNGMFFLRTVFNSDAPIACRTIETEFVPIAKMYRMDAAFYPASSATRAIIMASKSDHCVADLLYRRRTGALPIDVACIVSNHVDLSYLAKADNIPFCHLPISPENKIEQEAALAEIIKREGVSLVILARYMQILSANLCASMPGRIINIHHSFLPGFKGAQPYHQAHARGVKLIGATAHYVTPDLDEGPIIEQEITRVTHNMSVSDFVGIGKDIESLVLARAVKWHCEHRVMLDGHRTLIL